MYKHILLPYDGSELSEKALGEGIGLARSEHAKITLMYVFTPHHLMVGGGRAVPGLKQLQDQYAEGLRTEARAMLETGRQRAAAAGIECATLLEDGNNPHQQIIDAARREKCDLILMASHGRRGIEGMVVGSQTVKVLTHTTTPVLVVR